MYKLVDNSKYITSYDVAGTDYFVIIRCESDVELSWFYNSYLGNYKYGVVVQMFGSKLDCSLSHFKELIELNLFDYIKGYRDYYEF